MEPDTRPSVVVVGAGFAGLEAAKLLGRSSDVRVTVVDRKNHHLFQPLLYQVATAALDPSDIAAPIRTVLRRHRNTEVVLARVSAIDRQARRVCFEDGGSVAYDHLILATGADDTYFGHPSWEGDAPGLKTLEDALEVRRRVLFAFEEAERETDPARRQAWLTFVIIGGGPTGVELAGSLSEMAHRVLPRDFRHIDTHDARIVLIEGMPRVLPAYSEKLSARALRTLERLKIQVRLGGRVTAVDAQGVQVGEERIAARTVLWGAGVVPSPLAGVLGGPMDRPGRVVVTPELNLPGDPLISVVGDVAHVEEANGQLVPGIAPAAMQMGRHAARNVLARVHGQPAQPFHYLNKGMFAVIGRGAAVGSLFGRWEVGGFFAWLMWATIHLLYLVGFRSRLAVAFTWTYSYLTWRRIARLITATPWSRADPEPASAPGAVAGSELARVGAPTTGDAGRVDGSSARRPAG
jgi:NADH dehydrogenase